MGSQNSPGSLGPTGTTNTGGGLSQTQMNNAQGMPFPGSGGTLGGSTAQGGIGGPQSGNGMTPGPMGIPMGAPSSQNPLGQGAGLNQGAGQGMQWNLGQFLQSLFGRQGGMGMNTNGGMPPMGNPMPMPFPGSPGFPQGAQGGPPNGGLPPGLVNGRQLNPGVRADGTWRPHWMETHPGLHNPGGQVPQGQAVGVTGDPNMQGPPQYRPYMPNRQFNPHPMGIMAPPPGTPTNGNTY